MATFLVEMEYFEIPDILANLVNKVLKTGVTCFLGGGSNFHLTFSTSRQKEVDSLLRANLEGRVAVSSTLQTKLLIY